MLPPPLGGQPAHEKRATEVAESIMHTRTPSRRDPKDYGLLPGSQTSAQDHSTGTIMSLIQDVAMTSRGEI
jgi:hypothetical protein